jgi:hypothetical protein
VYAFRSILSAPTILTAFCNFRVITQAIKQGHLVERINLLITNSGLIALQDSEKHLVSVHICPKCGHAMKLAEIDFNAITTGVLLCPRCDWSGRIQIQVVDANSIAH